jgi:hypothetical protein
VRHWADGGETKLDNLVLLCRFHHRLVHEEGFRVHFPRTGKLYFLDPKMRLLPDVAQPPATRLGSAEAPPSNPAEPLMCENRAHGIEPDFRTSSARYKRDDDVPSELYLRALERLDELEELEEGPEDSSGADAAA